MALLLPFLSHLQSLRQFQPTRPPAFAALLLSLPLLLASQASLAGENATAADNNPPRI